MLNCLDDGKMDLETELHIQMQTVTLYHMAIAKLQFNAQKVSIHTHLFSATRHETHVTLWLLQQVTQGTHYYWWL